MLTQLRKVLPNFSKNAMRSMSSMRLDGHQGSSFMDIGSRRIFNQVSSFWKDLRNNDLKSHAVLDCMYLCDLMIGSVISIINWSPNLFNHSILINLSILCFLLWFV